MRAGWLAIALAGCGFSSRAVPADGADAAAGDGPTPDACVSATEQFQTCGLDSGSDVTITADGVYNTDTGIVTFTATSAQLKLDDTHVASTPGPMIDVIAARAFALEATLSVEGSLPLAIYASGDVTIEGELSVAIGGAGARVTCDAMATMGLADSNGGGGGGGGAFQGAGGAGQAGHTGTTAGGTGGSALISPGALVGGCAGAAGGDGQSAATGGLGGFGGGALLIVTPGAIRIASSCGLDAGGGGGHPGTGDKGGGGGGGAGGLIALEAATIVNLGYVVANGGGGGEGAQSGTAQAGWRGDDGHLDATPALGGSGGSNGGGGGGGNGGDGGDGGAGAMLDGSAATDAESDGGGGGGGGVGFIGVAGDTTSSTGIFSPAITHWP